MNTIKVYAILPEDADNKTAPFEMTDAEFIKEAETQMLYWTLPEFQQSFNTDKIDSRFSIRIIDEEDTDTISIKWGIDDVIGRARENDIDITENEAREILATMDRRHDASIGINWDVIDCHVDMFVQDHPRQPKPGFIVLQVLMGSFQPVFKDDDKLMFFDTEAAAQAEIDEHLVDVKQAVKNGFMSDEYTQEDYKIIPAVKTGATIDCEVDGDKYTMDITDDDFTPVDRS